MVDQTLLIRGCNSLVINSLHCQQGFDESNQGDHKKPPNIILEISHIFGVQTSNRRHTATYLHSHAGQRIDEALRAVGQDEQLNMTRVENAISSVVGPSFQRSIAERQIRYDQVHDECSKLVAYFVSRFAIIYSPFNKQQKYYQGHQAKISCLTRHPSRFVVATGEVKEYPQIHVWDCQSREPLSILSTSHLGGVIQIAFSPEG